MKKLFLSILLAIVVAIPQESSAQIDLGKALGLLLGESAQQQTPSRSPLAEIAEKAPAAKDLCHTWAYDRVYLKYLGTSPLADAALQQVDGSAQAALKNAGIVSGAFTFTLRRNGECFIMRDGEALDGSYEYIAEKGRVTLKTSFEGATYSNKGFFVKEGKNLVLMVDARDVLSTLLAIYPEYRTDQTVVMIDGILQQFKGVYVCVEFRR